ncbi:hypothetical protein BGX31_000549, partial [Mortierella sp. GBA43]
HAFVYYDEDVYDSVLIDRSGHRHVTQLLYDSDKNVYYVYYRWNETEYTLDGPHETVEAAKEAYLISYKKTFDIEWSERHTVVSEKWTVETIVHEEYEEIEEVQEVIEESEVEEIIRIQEKEAQGVKTEETKIVHKDDKITVQKEVEVKKDVVVDDVHIRETVTEVTTGHVAKEAVPKGNSWFRKAISAAGSAAGSVGGAVKGAAIGVAAGTAVVAAGAGAAAHGALQQADGVWKRTVEVLTTRKAHVDEKCPVNHAVVYYDEDVYDSEIVEVSTGIKHITQLIYDSQTNVYYVYYRYGEEIKLDGPHTTVESAKTAFQENYKNKFSIEWKERETAVNQHWTVQVKTYETFEEQEVIEEIIEEEEAKKIIATEIVETKAGKEVLVEKDRHVVIKEDVQEEVIIAEEEIKVVEPAVSQKTSWFRRAVSGVGSAVGSAAGAVGSAAGAVGSAAGSAVGAVAHGAESAYHTAGDVTKKVAIGGAVLTVGAAAGVGIAAAGAVKKVDGVWKRTVQVLTTKKAKVDEKCPIAKHALVYYDEDVYDSVVIDRSGHRHITQLLYDSDKNVYYVYYRWNETEYTLDGPHETVEAAKEAYLISYKKTFDIEWSERHTVVSDKWTVETIVHEEYEEIEEVEEVVENVEVVERELQEQKKISSEQTTIQDTVIRQGGSTTHDHHEHSKKTTGQELIANLPEFSEARAGIDVNTGAAVGVIDLRTREAYREVPAHLRPRAWVSLHVGGWQDAPHELQGFMRLDDQSGQRLMETARDDAQGKCQESSPIDNLRLPEIVGLFAQKLYKHFGEELPQELTMERLSELGPRRG